MKKILLVHGWNYLNYSSSGCKDAWSNRSRFVEKLSIDFDVVKFNLPGFCGEPDPPSAWGLNDYVSFVNKIISEENPDYIIGYSFGGAIALRWKSTYIGRKSKVILISPAIMRSYISSNVVSRFSKFKSLLPKIMLVKLRDLYMTYIIRNPFYSTATPLMREVYRKIVVEDLRPELATLKESVTLIYGERDADTPVSLIRDALSRSAVKHDLHVIDSGDHDIGNTHIEEIIACIKGY